MGLSFSSPLGGHHTGLGKWTSMSCKKVLKSSNDTLPMVIVEYILNG